MFIKSVVVGSIFMMLSAIMIIIMRDLKTNKEKNRKKIVGCCKFCRKIGRILMCGSLLLLTIDVVKIYCSCLYGVIYIISRNENLASYLSLSIVLISIDSMLICGLKIVKKKIFIRNKQFKLIQNMAVEYVNDKLRFINNLPVDGVIHIINLFLILWANIMKSLEIDSSITTTSIYMGIATYYAAKKVGDYFVKKYSKFWINLDNKIFNTNEINQAINFRMEDMENVNDRIFENYIKTGRFELPIINKKEKEMIFGDKPVKEKI